MKKYFIGVALALTAGVGFWFVPGSLLANRGLPALKGRIRLLSPAPGRPVSGSLQPSQPGTPPSEDPLLPEREFEELAQETVKSFPTREQMRKLSAEEAHHTSEALLLAGRKLGAIRKALSQNPELAPAALRFYEKCFVNSASVESVRALCLANYSRIEGITPDAQITRAGARVARIAAKLL